MPETPAPAAAPAAPLPTATADIDTALDAAYEADLAVTVATQAVAPPVAETVAPVAVSAPVPEAVPAVAPVAVPAPVPTVEAAVPEAVATPAEQREDTAQRAMTLHRELNRGRSEGESGFVSLRTCIEQIEGANTPTVAEPAAPAPSQVEALSGQTTELNEKANAIYAQLKEFADAGVAGTSELVDLQRNLDEINIERGALASELKQAKAADAAAQAQASEQARVNRHSEGRANAMKLFPTCGDAATPLGKECAAMVKEMQNPAHPDHKKLYRDDAATVVATNAARSFAERTAKATGRPVVAIMAELMTASAAPVPPQTALPEPFKVLPAPGSATTATPVPSQSADQKAAAVGPTDWRAAEAALSEGIPELYAIR